MLMHNLMQAYTHAQRKENDMLELPYAKLTRPCARAAKIVFSIHFWRFAYAALRKTLHGLTQRIENLIPIEPLGRTSSKENQNERTSQQHF